MVVARIRTRSTTRVAGAVSTAAAPKLPTGVPLLGGPTASARGAVFVRIAGSCFGAQFRCKGRDLQKLSSPEL